MKLVKESLENSLVNLSEYDKYFAVGDTGELRIYLQDNLSQSNIDQLTLNLQGVILTFPIVQDARILVIRFQKAVGTLAIIGESTVNGVIGWQLFKVTGAVFPVWGWVVGGLAAGYVLLGGKKWPGKK